MKWKHGKSILRSKNMENSNYNKKFSGPIQNINIDIKANNIKLGI